MNLYDIAYSAAVGIAAPYWLARPKARTKVLRAFRERVGRGLSRDTNRPAVMIHAVSLGEINATRGLVQQLAQQRPELQFIISATTDTGFARGQEMYGKDPNVTLIRYPLDFSSAVGRCLDALRPSVVALMELELWPNFLLHCQRRGIPVVLLNGRVTEPSFRRYGLIKPVVGRMLRRLSAICAQDQTYANRFIALGAAPTAVHITGTMKFDTATVADRVEGDRELAGAVGLRPGEEPIWVCGSTGPGEEEIILPIYRELLAKFPKLRLVIVPRKPERFDEVAAMIKAAGFELVRRSQTVGSASADRLPSSSSEATNNRSAEADPTRSQAREDRGLRIEDRKETDRAAPSSILHPPSSPVILGDTMGELRKFYSLADVVFVGRSLVDLGARQHGSDMIEPAALGKPVIVGQYTGNFAEAVNRLRDADAIRIVFENWQLRKMLELWLPKLEEAAAVGRRAQQVVVESKGATERNVAVVAGLLPVVRHSEAFR